MRRDRGESIGDLVRDYNGDVVRSCQVAEELAEANELSGALGHREAPTPTPISTRLAVVVRELCTIICGHGVEDHKANIVPGYCNGDLVGKDMILGFKIWRLYAKDAVKRGSR